MDQAHLDHAHDQPGGHPVPGRVSNRDTDATVRHLYEVIVVTADLSGRAHMADDLDVVERDVASRQHRELKLARKGQLFRLAAVVAFYVMQATGLGAHLFN